MQRIRRSVVQIVAVFALSSATHAAAYASTRSFQFQFDWDDGPLTGQTTIGQFSFDAELFHPTQYVQADQLFGQFSVNINGETFDEQQASGHYLRFEPDGRLRMMAVGNNCGPVTCYVDNPRDWTIAWDGGVVGYALYAHAANQFSYAEGIALQEISPVPEPSGWVLGLLAGPFLAWVLRRVRHVDS